MGDVCLCGWGCHTWSRVSGHARGMRSKWLTIFAGISALHRDQDGAIALLDQALKMRPLESVCDEIIIPTLRVRSRTAMMVSLRSRDVVFICARGTRLA